MSLMRLRCSLCHRFIAIARFGINVEFTAGKFHGVRALTIRSSRCRVAARLNSGVRHQGNIAMNSNFEEAMEPVTRRMSETYLNQMRSAAIGGGSFSAAVILVLLQVGLSSVALTVSFYAAAIGIPIWIVVWQYVQPYILYGPVSYDHFRKASSLGVAVLLAVLGLVAISVSFVSLIWHMSACAAVIFAILCLFAVVLIVVHGQSVLAAVKQKDSGQGA